MDIVRRDMKHLFRLFLMISILPSAYAQMGQEPSVADLLPLRSCAQATSRLISGERIPSGWSSDDENSFYFLDCDDDYDKGQDHYVFTPMGIYYFFIKEHKDYKGGFEGTQFRLTLESNTYYFKSDITGGMGDLYDATGKNLSLSQTDPERMMIDASAKNPVINYYMKTLTGKSDLKASILAEPAVGERLAKAHACMQKEILELGSSLTEVYKARRDYHQVPPETLVTYQAFVESILLTPACRADVKISESFDQFLGDIRK